jgi:molybdopterin converting factor small subunit
MQIHIQLFSILRACLPADADRGKATITLPEGATLADLLTHLGVDRYLGLEAGEVVGKAGWEMLVGGAYEPNIGRVLQDEDQVLIFPPASGG